MHIKKKMHDRAVKMKLTKPKRSNIIGTYIAPIWRENHIGSSDEEDDEDEVRRKKDERKAQRLKEKEAKIAALNEQRELARKFRSEEDVAKEREAKARVTVEVKDLRIGKPRETSNF